ncbi:TIGR01459 family HAD-type hydrolase [Mesorhizobium sp. SB112]|uniref:TIGR01459 family HAD-type hydrolase n=1 Tax=Mesorhizobium sp. SB112 TaxID=3151853 RepID=UPI003263FDEE
MKNDPASIDLAGLIDRYEVFFIDQFGVLRDDEKAYEGAVDALETLKKAGKTIVILSNSGRSGEHNVKRLAPLGFAPSSFDHFVTSGDVAYAMLAGSATSGKCFTISSGGDTDLADRLGMESVESSVDADIVIISGSESERIAMDDYREMLRPAAENNRPCFCTNPDLLKLSKGTVAPGAGAIADLYEELGGSVTRIGKPFAGIYEYALQLCGIADKASVICIGDSIDHDIAGAANAGLQSVLVETGILSDKNAEERNALMAEIDVWPTFIMKQFRA